MSDSVRPHRWPPARPWDSPGKDTGVGCPCLLRSFSYHQPNHLGFWQVLGHLVVFLASLGAFLSSRWALCWIGYYSLSNSVCLFVFVFCFFFIQLRFLTHHLSNLPVTCLVLPLSLWWYLFEKLQARVNSFICFLSNLSVDRWILLEKEKTTELDRLEPWYIHDHRHQGVCQYCSAALPGCFG